MSESNRTKLRRRVVVAGAALALLGSLLHPHGSAAVPGSPDPAWGNASFGTDGVSSVAPPAGTETSSADVVVTPSGASWHAEVVTPIGGGARSVRLVRRDPLGAVVGTVPLSPSPISDTVRLAADGEDVFVAALSLLGTGSPGWVARVQDDLALDPSFSADGVLNFAELGVAPGGCGFGSCAGFSSGFGVDDDGRPVVTIGQNQNKVVRVLPTGQLDTTFGVGGVASIPTNAYMSLVIDSQDRILVAGFSGLSRLLPDGTPDPGFGPNASGSTTLGELAPGLGCVFIWCEVALPSDGTILFNGNAGLVEIAGDGTSAEVHPIACDAPCNLPISPFVTGSAPGQVHLVSGARLATADLPLADGPLDLTFTELPRLGQILVARPGATDTTAFVAGQRSIPQGEPKQAFMAKLRLDVPPPPPPPPPTGTLSPPSGSWERGAEPNGNGPIVPIDYSCSNSPVCEAVLVGGDLPPVLSDDDLENLWGPSVSSGQMVDLSGSGWDVQTLVVRAVDVATGQYVEVARARYELTNPGGDSGTTVDGGTLSTGTTPSRQDLVTASVTTPIGGSVSIQGSLGGFVGPGVEFFGQSLTISAPEQTAAAPLRLTFQLHSSMLGGASAGAVEVWDNDGELVPNCASGSGAVVANPDPCVAERASLGAGGGARVVVLSSRSGGWWGLGRFTQATVSDTTANGGTVASGELSSFDPLTTTVVTPTGGFVEFVEGPLEAPSPVGYALFGQQVVVTAPDQSVGDPLVLSFSLAGALLGGTDPAGVEVFRNSVVVADCVDGVAATSAVPDPCVRQREVLPDGGVRVSVLSSRASTWTFGVQDAPSGPRVSVGDQSGLERDSVTGSVFVPVTLSEPSVEPVVVRFYTVGGSATSGVDYSRWGTPASPRSVTIPAGSLQTTVNVPVSADALVEGDEEFSVVVSSVSGGDAVIGDGTGVATIVDADGVSGVNPAVTVSSGSIHEGDDGRRRVQFQVHLSRASSSGVTISYGTADGSAVAPGDFVAKLPGTVVFAPGQISKTIDVLVNSNTVVGGGREFSLNVSVTGGSPVEGLDLVGVARIIDDD